jgi:hypothetical protein
MYVLCQLYTYITFCVLVVIKTRHKQTIQRYCNCSMSEYQSSTQFTRWTLDVATQCGYWLTIVSFYWFCFQSENTRSPLCALQQCMWGIKKCMHIMHNLKLNVDFMMHDRLFILPVQQQSMNQWMSRTQSYRRCYMRKSLLSATSAKSLGKRVARKNRVISKQYGECRFVPCRWLVSCITMFLCRTQLLFSSEDFTYTTHSELMIQ